MKPIEKLLLFTLFFLLIFQKTSAQCDRTETLRVCDMTTVDIDGIGGSDGFIDLYDEFGLVPQAGDEWFDPGFNFALDSGTGILRLWDLKNASQTVNDYIFILRNSSCTSGEVARVNLILGPYSGSALPPSGPNNVNVEVCDINDVCSLMPIPDLDLFETLVSLDGVPPPHLNGVWEYVGPPNPNVLLDGSGFSTTIAYTPGGGRVDSEDYEFRYTVNGFDPSCPSQSVTNVKVSVVRQVFSGYASQLNICENRILGGEFDSDLNLRDNDFLLNEDIEGTWTLVSGQIDTPDDSSVNLKTLYDNIIAVNPRFGCQEFEFKYTVEQRSGVCDDMTSIVKFTIFEELKPFTQRDAPPEICSNEFADASTDLYDFIEFTEEGGVIFDYIDGDVVNDYVEWEFVSGPSDLNLEANLLNEAITPRDQRHRGIINIPRAAPGTYRFRYTVSPLKLCPIFDSQTLYNPNFCTPSITLGHPCNDLSTEITIIILPIDYPGEDTIASVCESSVQVDLRSLLRTNGTSIVTTGVWTNSAGDVINNTFVFPTSDVAQTFNFTYTTVSTGGCTETADLALTINKLPNAGEDGSTTVCSDNLTVTLFDLLGGTPDTTGTWTGPFGYVSTDHLGVFDANDDMLPILGAGIYTYTAPANAGCSSSDSASVEITIVDPIEIGDDVNESFCKIDGRVNLFSLLDRDTVRTGVFEDTDNTGALSADGVLEFATLTNAIYNFRYVVRNATPCDESSLNVSIQIIDLPIPNVPAQEFCILDAVRLEDIEVDVLNYNWYATQESETPIIDNPILLDNQVYYIATVDVDNCESERLEVMITILNTGERSSTGELCTLDFQDGVSPNGDGQNDTFDLLIEEVYNIPEAFPDFDIKIFNRYGSLVYEGNNNTEEFRGESNVSVRLGDDLPSGTYFYIFSPNFENNIPIQGSFYLSR
ncbi:gliding motility-associated C-terminal domain-containing protein [Aquimarina algiphila]|uniref:gliding motility-associated C-terminal domain-containing protein n=1 Tax=Aquimarina algiphila TaxID=2047982 RepID=UPI00232EA8A2|nr:gliding motility-associated C-terminal domain-containing protein [Aquimarina algiphila]